MGDMVTIEQEVFTALMHAMANPLRSYAISKDMQYSSLEMLLLTLLDSEVTYAIIGDDTDRITRLDSFIAEQRGARKCAHNRADFVIVLGKELGKAIWECKQGSLAYPDQSATIIYALDLLQSENRFWGVGPGIPDFEKRYFPALSESDLLDAHLMQKSYPQGVDRVVVDAVGTCLAIPRTTELKQEAN